MDNKFRLDKKDIRMSNRLKGDLRRLDSVMSKYYNDKIYDITSLKEVKVNV